MKRYHPALVALHWLLALMIGGALIIGSQIMAETPNSDPAKIGMLRNHMIIGIAILVLMIIRLVVRLRSKTPPQADAGHPALNTLGAETHRALYIIIFLMVASGMGISILAGLPDIVFFGSGAPLPQTFNGLLPRSAHGVLAKLLAVLIVGHAAAALYHQFVRKDGLLSRMWFGKR